MDIFKGIPNKMGLIVDGKTFYEYFENNPNGRFSDLWFKNLILKVADVLNQDCIDANLQGTTLIQVQEYINMIKTDVWINEFITDFNIGSVQKLIRLQKNFKDFKDFEITRIDINHRSTIPLVCKKSGPCSFAEFAFDESKNFWQPNNSPHIFYYTEGFISETVDIDWIKLDDPRNLNYRIVQANPKSKMGNEFYTYIQVQLRDSKTGEFKWYFVEARPNIK
jgi:hypothetical protein